MPLFTKPSKDLVYDLINEANPDLPELLSVANAKLDNPVTATVSGRPELNTAITCIPVGGAYIGRKTLNYRRLGLNILLRGLTVQIDKYSENQSGSNSTVFTVYNLLPLINAKYGLNLTTDDVIDANILRGNVQEGGQYTTTVTVTAKATSLGYVGSFALKWKGAPQDLESMITVTDLNARSFPGGNDFSGAHKTIVNFMGFGVDWTTWLAANPWPTNYPTSIGAGLWPQYTTWFTKYLAELNALYGTNLTASWGVDVTEGSPTGSRVITLPDANFPELNSRYYNRCVVVYAIDAAGDKAGMFALHFNV